MLREALPPGWRIARLGELGEVNRGRSRHRPRYAEHLYGGPYPFLQTGDIRDSGGRITRHSQTYSEAGLEQSRLWPTGTLCITIAANIAETAVLTYPACFPDSIVGFIADESKCDVYFIEYMFRRLRRQIQHEASGSVQNNINLGTLGRLSFPLPSLIEQKAIVSILRILDDKIELNRRMSQTLEAMAGAIFKSWFVDFEPRPEGDTSRSYKESPLGLIPAGWRVGSFLETVDVIGGGTPRTSVREFWNGDIPWFSVTDTPPTSDIFVIDTAKKITHIGLDNSSARLLPFGATILSARGTVGNLALTGVPMAMNQSCYGLVGRDGYGPFFVYFSARMLVSILRQRTHGSVFDTVTRDTLAGVQIVIPPKQLAGEFDRVVSPLLSKILNNLHESKTLAAIRDALLPKLLSGEIRVKQAEKVVEAVV